VNASEISLTVSTGRAIGTGPSRRVREDGDVPAVVYGLGIDPVSVTVPKRELRRALSTDAGQNALIQLDIDGSDALCIVTELQRHRVRRDVIHVDFLRIDPDKQLTVDVPVMLHGRAEKLEQMLGMVDQLMYTLSVQAPPGSIPNQLDADISHLEIGISLTVGEIQLPAGVSTTVDPDEPIAMGSPTRSTIIKQQEEARAARIASGEATEEDLAFVAGEADGTGGGDSDAD
jgi:large subunit ribosomal protein L25